MPRHILARSDGFVIALVGALYSYSQPCSHTLPVLAAVIKIVFAHRLFGHASRGSPEGLMQAYGPAVLPRGSPCIWTPSWCGVSPAVRRGSGDPSFHFSSCRRFSHSQPCFPRVSRGFDAGLWSRGAASRQSLHMDIELMCGLTRCASSCRRSSSSQPCFPRVSRGFDAGLWSRGAASWQPLHMDFESSSLGLGDRPSTIIAWMRARRGVGGKGRGVSDPHP